MLNSQNRPTGSLANLAVTPEQRKANLEKAARTRRENRDKKWAEIYERYRKEWLFQTTFERAAATLGISSHTIRRIARWGDEQRLKK